MRIFISAIVSICFSLLLMAQDTSYPFQNASLTIDERVDDLISRLTLEEKIDQLMHITPAIDRLGVPAYSWWNESLHGVARAGRATVFPQAIGMAASFDEDLLFRVADAISTEARAKYNLFSKQGMRGRYQGLTFWSPNVNIFRDPRWGRGQETYGEDPWLTSRLGVAYVKGLQGDHPKYLKAAGMGKHYAVHSGPEELRHEFNAEVSQKDLWETYLPAFEALVTEANVEGMMGAYNRTNGDVCCAHDYLMDEVLRKKWGFDGYFVSDCWALVDFHSGHKIVSSPAEAAAMALNAGCNLNCGSTYPQLKQSIAEGLTTEEEIDRNLRQLLPTRFKLGLFDPIGSTPWDDLDGSVIRQEKHVNLALEAATKSMVLLKNDNSILPLSKDTKSVYVMGPTASNNQALLANYFGVSDDMKTIVEGIAGTVSDHTLIRYVQGALLDETNRNPIDWFSPIANEFEVTILCLGITQLIEGEEGEAIASRTKGDRKSIRLPQNQIDFLKKMREVSEKLVVVITGGSAISIPEVYELADAVLFAWYPGEQGGNAVANVLFGEANPSGRLPVTVPRSVDDLPPFEDYNMQGRTYRYMETDPMFPFGFGLSYTTYLYSNLSLSKKRLKKGDNLDLTFTLTNTGTRTGDEISQLYVKDNAASVDVPFYSLKGVKRVSLEPGESKDVTFTITPEAFALVNEQGESILESGEFTIYVGGSVPTEVATQLGAPAFLQELVEVK